MAQTFNYQGVAPVAFESVSAVTATNSVDLGTTRTQGAEEYIYVYNAGAASASPGQYMVMSANSGYSLTVSSVTMYDFPMGFVKHTTIPAASYGWILTKGFLNVLGQSNLSWAISDLLVPGSGGRVANPTGQVSFICALVYNPIGQAVSAGATVGAGTGLVFQAYVRAYGS